MLKHHSNNVFSMKILCFSTKNQQIVDSFFRDITFFFRNIGLFFSFFLFGRRLKYEFALSRNALTRGLPVYSNVYLSINRGRFPLFWRVTKIRRSRVLGGTALPPPGLPQLLLGIKYRAGDSPSFSLSPF